MKKLFALVLVVALSLVSVATFAEGESFKGVVGEGTPSAEVHITPTVEVNAPGYVDVTITQGENPVLTFKKLYTADPVSYQLIEDENRSVDITVKNSSIAADDEDESDWDGTIYVTAEVSPLTDVGAKADFDEPIAEDDNDIENGGAEKTYTLTYTPDGTVETVPEGEALEVTVTFTISTTAD